MKLLTTVTTIFLVISPVKLSIPLCESVNFTVVCASTDKMSGIPQPRPLKVDLGIHFNDLIEINEEANTIKISIKLTETWKDSRITTNAKGKYHQLDTQDLKNIWFPEMYFFNSLKVEKLLGMGSKITNTL